MRRTHLRTRRHGPRPRQTPPGHPRRPRLEHSPHLVHRLVARPRAADKEIDRDPRSPEANQALRKEWSGEIASKRKGRVVTGSHWCPFAPFSAIWPPFSVPMPVHEDTKVHVSTRTGTRKV